MSLKEFSSLVKRIKLVDKIKSKTKKDGDELCPNEYNVLNSDVLVLNMIGSGSANGEAFKSCTPYDKNTHTCDKTNEILLSTKKIPLTNFQKYFFDERHEYNFLNGVDVFVELKCMELCNIILLNRTQICPNLPLYYNYYLCNNCNYENPQILKKNNRLYKYIETLDDNLYKIKNKKVYKKLLGDITDSLKQQNKSIVDNDYTDSLIKKIGKKSAYILRDTINNMVSKSCVLLTNEYANEGDLKTWLKKDRSVLEWTNMYFQVFAGLYTLQKHFDLTHHDLHWGNVLVHRIEENRGFLNYKIDDDYYKFSNTGYIFTLWDFGYARITDKMQAKNDKYYNPNINRYTDDYFRIANAIHWNEKKDENGNSNGSTPKEMFEFFNITEKLFKASIPLKYIFKKLFGSFLTPRSMGEREQKTTLYYKIDDNNMPDLPNHLLWLLNLTNDYTKTKGHYTTKKIIKNHKIDLSDTTKTFSYISQTYRTLGESTIHDIIKNIK